MLEILHGPFVLLRLGPRSESAQVFPLARARIELSRVQPIAAGSKFANHGFSFSARALGQRAGLTLTRSVSEGLPSKPNAECHYPPTLARKALTAELKSS